MALAGCLAIPLAYLISAAARETPTLKPHCAQPINHPARHPGAGLGTGFVRVFGLWASCRVLALGLTYGGMLRKVYAEILESADTTPARALRLSGAGCPQAILYGLIPAVVAKEMTSLHRLSLGMRGSRFGRHGALSALEA